MVLVGGWVGNGKLWKVFPFMGGLKLRETSLDAHLKHLGNSQVV